jgi:hypothetical protein
MLTLLVGREASGKSSSRAPLSNRYSEIPSTVATFAGGAANPPPVMLAKAAKSKKDMRRMNCLPELQQNEKP